MKKLFLVGLLLALSSCYVYKVPVPKEDEEPKTIQEIIDGKNFYRITVNDKSEKIIFDEWDKDTLVAHGLHKEKRKFRIHKDDIQKVEERRFAKWPTNGITIATYILLGAGIFLLLL